VIFKNRRRANWSCHCLTWNQTTKLQKHES